MYAFDCRNHGDSAVLNKSVLEKSCKHSHCYKPGFQLPVDGDLGANGSPIPNVLHS